jgi:uncharacterized protein YegP (UPF0339 family)
MGQSTSDNRLLNWYSRRIGEPSTSDEVTGYWLFVAGVLLGMAGLALFFWTDSATESRGLAYGLAALAPPFVLLGAIIRFPLRRAATSLGYGGAVVSFVAVVWFVAIYPDSWFVATGRPDIIGLYGIGLVAIGVAGAVIPMVTDPLLTHSQKTARANASAAVSGDLAAATEHTEALEADKEELEADKQALETEVDRLETQVENLQTAAAESRQSAARFELFADKGGKFRWRLRHRNGNIVADSAQGYTALHNAQKGMQSVRRNALGAGTLRIEPDPETDSKDDPVPDDATDPVVAVPDAVEAVESRATFEQFTDKAGESRWRLRHDNGNIIADSSEGYSSKSAARKSIDRLKGYVGPADYLWFDPAGFEVYRDNANEWRWRLVHRNGNILADGGEGYSRRHDANRAVDRIRERVDELTFSIFEDSSGEFRWRLQNDSGEILGDSGEGYSSQREAQNAVNRVKNHAPNADTLEIGVAAFEIFEDKAGEFRWRLRHRNGNILADCGGGYANRSNARDGIESVKRNAPGAETE